LARQSKGLGHRDQPKISEEGNLAIWCDREGIDPGPDDEAVEAGSLVGGDEKNQKPSTDEKV
jgi:hypothetical protein